MYLSGWVTSIRPGGKLSRLKKKYLPDLKMLSGFQTNLFRLFQGSLLKLHLYRGSIVYHRASTGSCSFIAEVDGTVGGFFISHLSCTLPGFVTWHLSLFASRSPSITHIRADGGQLDGPQYPLSLFWNQYCLKWFSFFSLFFFFCLFSPAVGKDFIPPRITPAGLCREILQIRMDFTVMKPQHAAATSPPGCSCPAI